MFSHCLFFLSSSPTVKKLCSFWLIGGFKNTRRFERDSEQCVWVWVIDWWLVIICKTDWRVYVYIEEELWVMVRQCDWVSVNTAEWEQRSVSVWLNMLDFIYPYISLLSLSLWVCKHGSAEAKHTSSVSLLWHQNVFRPFPVRFPFSDNYLNQGYL